MNPIHAAIQSDTIIELQREAAHCREETARYRAIAEGHLDTINVLRQRAFQKSFPSSQPDPNLKTITRLERKVNELHARMESERARGYRDGLQKMISALNRQRHLVGSMTIDYAVALAESLLSAQLAASPESDLIAKEVVKVFLAASASRAFNQCHDSQCDQHQHHD
jgi:hypothetical protein